MGALGRMPPEPHEDMKLAKAKGKTAKSPASHADADAALKGSASGAYISKTGLNLRLRKCAIAGDLARLSCVPADSKGNDHHEARRHLSPRLHRQATRAVVALAPRSPAKARPMRSIAGKAIVLRGRPEDTGPVLLGWRPSDDYRANTALTWIRWTCRPSSVADRKDMPLLSEDD